MGVKGLLGTAGSLPVACVSSPHTNTGLTVSSHLLDRQTASSGQEFFVSTSKLQRCVSELLSVHLGKYTIRENTRPDWLISSEGSRLELDFYVEELEVAIEVQGSQHYVYTPHFHGDYDSFKRYLRFDKEKQQLCDQRGIQLLEIATEQEALWIIPFLAPPIEVRSNLPYIEPDSVRNLKRRALAKVKEGKTWMRYRHYQRLRRRLRKKNRRALGRGDKQMSRGLQKEIAKANTMMARYKRVVDTELRRAVVRLGKLARPKV